MEDKFVQINKLKEYLTQIISLYEAEKNRNLELVSLNNKLKLEINNKTDYIENLEKQTETLKFAKTISLTSKDKEEVVKKINKIVKEIDKSIGLLNE